MFERIVVGSDGSETAAKAVEAAADLARTHGSALHVVTAYRSHEPVSPGGGAWSAADGADAGIRHSVAEEIVERITTGLAESGLPSQAHAIAGSAADALISVASDVGADLIIVGSKGMSRRVLGSVPNSVAHGAPCAVLIVKTA